VNYTMRDGKRINTAADDFGVSAKKGAEPWVKVPLKEMAAELKIMGMPGAIALLMLWYEAWRAKGKPFTLSNERLNQYGVKRDAKRLMLAKLEAAGRIRVERKGCRAPVIRRIRSV
jgi:hypothetical protein